MNDVGVDLLATSGTIQVHDMQVAHRQPRKTPGDLDRCLAVFRLARVVSLEESYAVPVFEVNGWDDSHVVT
jgi:hypothetical protein